MVRVRVAVVVAAFAALGGAGLLRAGLASSAGPSSSVPRLGCPRNDRHIPGSARPGAATELVPPGATTLVLCRFSPAGGPQPPPLPPRELVAQRLVTRGVTGLAQALDAIAPSTGAYSCPADWGMTLVADFGYPSGADDPVTVELTGCEGVGNGSVNRLGLGAAVVGRLSSLVPDPGAARLRVRLRVCGGPAPGHCSFESVTSCNPRGCARLDRVTLTAADGLTWRTQLRRGRRELDVPAGRYTARLFAEGRRVPTRLLQTQRIRLRRGRVTLLTFGVEVP